MAHLNFAFVPSAHKRSIELPVLKSRQKLTTILPYSLWLKLKRRQLTLHQIDVHLFLVDFSLVKFLVIVFKQTHAAINSSTQFSMYVYMGFAVAEAIQTYVRSSMIESFVSNIWEWARERK